MKSVLLVFLGSLLTFNTVFVNANGVMEKEGGAEGSCLYSKENIDINKLLSNPVFLKKSWDAPSYTLTAESPTGNKVVIHNWACETLSVQAELYLDRGEVNIREKVLWLSEQILEKEDQVFLKKKLKGKALGVGVHLFFEGLYMSQIMVSVSEDNAFIIVTLFGSLG